MIYPAFRMSPIDTHCFLVNGQFPLCFRSYLARDMEERKKRGERDQEERDDRQPPLDSCAMRVDWNADCANCFQTRITRIFIGSICHPDQSGGISRYLSLHDVSPFGYATNDKFAICHNRMGFPQEIGTRDDRDIWKAFVIRGIRA